MHVHIHTLRCLCHKWEPSGLKHCSVARTKARGEPWQKWHEHDGEEPEASHCSAEEWEFRMLNLALFEHDPGFHTHARACTTCKRLRRLASACCVLGHHEKGYISRRPQSQLCDAHRLPPCPRCTLKQQGVRHCCARGHQHVCTPFPTHRKRKLSSHSRVSHQKPCLSRPTQPLSVSQRSPHCPPTPLAPKCRRPKSPPPPSPPPHACTTGAGGDGCRGYSTSTASCVEAWQVQHSGYLTNTLQRF